MRTGKQMATDLREGLWTFLEDIRQATVGEEGINGTEVRGGVSPSGQLVRDSSSTSRSRDRGSEQGGMPSRSPSSSSLRGRGTQARISGKDTTTTTTAKSTDIDSSFWNEFGVDIPGQKSPNARGTSNHPPSARPPHDSNHLEANDEDNWDAWDSTPQPRKMHTPSSSRSTLESKRDQSPRSQTSSPRTSTSFGDWRPTSQNNSSIPDPSVSDGIPWPAITKLAPSKLTRTASSLMSEWERSLSPSPDRTGVVSPPLQEKESKKD